MSTDAIASTPAQRFTARATTYKGTPMRSRLEARYAAWLDENGIRWEYEPQCFASDTGQYLPDFLLHDIEVLGSQRDIYVEIKPTVGHVDNALRNRAAIIWDSMPDAFIAFEVPHELPEVHVSPELGRYAMRSQWARVAPTWLPALVQPIRSTWWEH